MADNTAQQQQLLDYYSNATPEMQQQIYNSGSNEVKTLLDSYKPQQTTPTTEVPTDRNGGVGGNGRPDQKGELTPETYNYYSNDTQAAQDKIVNNLYDYYQKTPNLFTNYQNFKNNFSYDARSDQQKKTLDDWWFGYDKSRQLSTKSIGDLTTLYSSGQLTDADLNNLKYFYPDKYNDVMNKVNAQNDMQQYSDMLYGGSTDDTDIMSAVKDQFLNYILGNRTNTALNFYDEYNAEINTPEMTEMSDRQTDLQAEIRKIDSDLNSLYKDIEKRYEGTGASKAKIQAIYADEAYDLQIQRNSLAIELEALATKYNSRIQQAQTNFEMKTKQYELENTEKNQYMKELGFAMDLINFETNEEADERAWKNRTKQIDYQYGNIDSLDPVARRKAVDNSVSQILDQYDGIPMQRSKDQMVEDVLKLVDSGMSLGEALTQNIVTPIKSKPEYGYWLNSKLGDNSPVQYQLNDNNERELVGGTGNVPLGTGGNNYKSIDLENGYGVKVDPNNTITINGQQYRITQLGGETKTSGIDFAPAVRGDNQEVQAFVSGKVIRSGIDKNTGNRYVEILGDNGYVYRYNHLNDWDTEYASGAGGSPYNGQRVEAGTVIGHMGQTGKAYGVHLDLAVYDGSRANSMAVSPLNIVDQAKVFFNSVNAQGLGIGSNGATTNNGDWEDVYYAVQQELISKNGSQFMKSDKGIELLDYAKRKAQEGMDGDTIIDNLTRLNTEGAIWRDPNNSNAYDAFERVFSKEYNSNQEKSYNFKETVERWIGEGKYEKAFEYIADEGVDMFLENEDKKKVSSVKESLQGLSDIQQLYQDYIDAGGKGWKFTRAKNKFGYDWLGTDTGAAQEIRTKLTMALNMFIKGMSGLTVSDAERKQYQQIFPKLGLSNAAFQGQIDNLISYFENDVNTIYGSALGASTYQGLQDWYKDNMGEYYSVVNHYASGIYHNKQSNKKIDLPAPKNGTNTSYINTGVLNSNELDFVLNGYN